MVKVVWTDQAINHVDQIAGYIAQDSPYQAHRVASLIFDATKRLELSPESGAIVPELEDRTIREVLIFSYRIIYQYIIEQQKIQVLGVIHAARILNWNVL